MLLVTGITGHTGRYFLQELIDHKYEGLIRCIVRKTSDTTMLDTSGLNIEKVYGDINDGDFLKNVMQGVDIVLHIAGIQKTLKVIEAATLNKVRQGIFVHTTGIFSKFKSASEEYQLIENEMKRIIKTNNNFMSITTLRPTMIYGDLCDLNMSKFIRMVDYFRVFPVINKGESLIQPVNARDLGRAYFQVLKVPKENLKSEYVVSGDVPITMVSAFKTISKALGKKIIFISFPLWSGVILARLLYILTLGRIDYIEKVQRMGEDRSFPHDDATNDFSYLPRSFDKGIKVEVEQYMNKKRGK
jgi:nucleoside-diphosphate-sugar epimerase